MSGPPLSATPTIPTSIQIATPFSYTISNSAIFPAGVNYNEPVFTLVGSQPTTFSNSAYTPDTDTYVTTSISLNIDPYEGNVSYYNFYGPTYYNLEKTFRVQLPWQPDPTNYGSPNGSQQIIFNVIEGSSTYSIALILNNANIGDTTRYVNVYGSLFDYNVEYDYYYSYNYGFIGNFAYTQANRTLEIINSLRSSYLGTQFVYSFNFFGGGITRLYSFAANIRTSYYFVLRPLIYPDVSGYPPLSTISISLGAKITYNGISYVAIGSLVNQIFREYGPLGRYNYSRWLPVELTPLEYNNNYNYFVGDRVVLNQTIYKALINNTDRFPPIEPSRWVVSDINYPQWNSSVNYAIGDRVYYNGLAYQATNTGSNFTPTTSNYVIWSPTSAPDNTVTFTSYGPAPVTSYNATFPTLSLSNTTSSEILPFITGNNSLTITFSSAGGFQSVPSNPLQVVVNQVILDVVKRTTTYPITILPVTITTTPTLTSPLSLITYQPFSYTYSIPDTLVNVGLRYNSNTTSTSLVPYIANGSSIYETLFRSTLGLTSSGTTRIVIEAILNGLAIATSDTTILTIAVAIISTPSITTGTLSLYKYEPFSYVFTVNSSLSEAFFQVNRSSSELQTFLAVSEDLQSVTFSGAFGISYSTPLNLIVDLVVGTTIISTQTILVSVGPGRFFPPAPNQNFQLYQYENVSNTFGSNIEFLTVAPMTTILSSPSLPSGLTFGGSANSWFIQGTPNLQVGQSNYQIIGSNSSNGRIVTNTISLRVNPQQIRITPSASSVTGLIVDIPIDPIITTAIRPATIYSNTFRYTWTSLPDGLNFQNSLGSNVSQPFEPLDDPLTITLVGAPSLAFATSLSTSAENLYQTRLTATQTNQTGAQTIGTSLFNFSLGETVLINVSNTVTLYKDKPLGTTDVLITAGSFFSSATISNITTDSLPPGLSLVEYISPTVYRLTGTPTEVNLSGSYTFTATNTNENSRSVTVSIPINPDVVTFGGLTPVNGTVLSYILSKTVTPIVFSATSTSTTSAPTYTASIPLENYGLTLNSITGILSGTPTTLLSSTTVTITATNIFGTTGTTTIVVTILPDVFTWPTYTPAYFQNKTITPFQFTITTLSGRPILSYSSDNLPSGLIINAAGLLTGSPGVASPGSFTITASTGFTIASQVYTYTIIADQLLILQTNETDTVSKVFSGVEYRTIQYSSDSFVNAVFSIGALTPTTSATIAVTSGGLLSGDFTSGVLNTTYLATLTAVYQGVTSTLPIYITNRSTDVIITAIRNGIAITDVFISIVTGASSFFNGSFTTITYTTSIAHGLLLNQSCQISGFIDSQEWANSFTPVTVTEVINSFQFKVILFFNIPVNQSFSNSTTPGYIGNIGSQFAYYKTAIPHGLTRSNTIFGSISELSSSFYNINSSYITPLIVPTSTTFVLLSDSGLLTSLTQQNGLLTYAGQPSTSTALTFTQPTQTVFTFFEYVPYTIPIQTTESENFIYYFSSAVPNGFQLIKDSTGVTATLSGISTTIDNQGILIYAKTATGFPSSIYITLKTITPFFVNPQSGAGAYTALLRNDVEGNSAQNARDNRTFPQVDPLAGPLMAPRAPDVVTPNDCILKLCKKPCPTCHTMM
jgi:hypothetical protein